MVVSFVVTFWGAFFAGNRIKFEVNTSKEDLVETCLKREKHEFFRFPSANGGK